MNRESEDLPADVERHFSRTETVLLDLADREGTSRIDYYRSGIFLCPVAREDPGPNSFFKENGYGLI